MYCGADNVFLAEISLLGKIVQLDDALFQRRLAKNYNIPFEKWNANIISGEDPQRLNDGITLPYCRLTYAHLELVNYVVDNQSHKNALMNEIIKCFRARFGKHIMFEIKRAISLIDSGYSYYTWDGQGVDFRSDSMLHYYHLNNLLKTLREALFIYPDFPELVQAYEKCLQRVEQITCQKRKT